MFCKKQYKIMSGFFHSEYSLALYLENFHIFMQSFSSQGSICSIKEVTPKNLLSWWLCAWILDGLPDEELQIPWRDSTEWNNKVS